MKLKLLIFIVIISMLILIMGAGLLYLALNILSQDTMESAADPKRSAQSPYSSASPTAKPEETAIIEEEDNSFRMIAVGDILLGRTVKVRVEATKDRYIYPFKKVAEILKKGDIVFGNLEEPITASTSGLTDIYHGGKYVLKNEVEAIEGIKYAGFNLLSLANNHILDYYDKGLKDTINILNENDIVYAGAGKNLSDARKLAIVKKGDLKVGMLAYTDMAYIMYKGNPPLTFNADENKAGVAPNSELYIKEDIKKARSKVDFLIVSLHWGVEDSFYATEQQQEFAHYLMDNGVDIILGHHTHQFQGIEIYKGKPIIYSMGNFIFDQNDPENQEGFILDMSFNEKKLQSLSAIPIRTINKAQIVPQSGRNAQALLKREQELCRNLNTKCIIKNDKLIFTLK